MKKLSAITASAAIALSAAAPLSAVPCAAEYQKKPVRIMCIGDSITDGYGTAGSYRKFLYNGLTANGYTVDMLGSKGGGWEPVFTDTDTGESFSYDDENTGYSGYSIMDYTGRNGIYETLVSTGCLSQSPDIVILQIGTNDIIDCHEIEASGERLSVLISYILSNISPDSALFVTTVPNLEPNRQDVYDWFMNYRHSPDWQVSYNDETVAKNVQASVDRYNAILRETVSDMQSGHNNLFLGDINSVITDTSSQLKDGVHPNDNGFRLMGKYWTDMLTEYLGAGSVPENKWRVSDLVKLSGCLLNKPDMKLSAEDITRYDLDGDSCLSGFDLTLMRSEILDGSVE
ncbi:MAG: hypothetical protein IJK31_07435 [Ruminococcus sp.]|nr:hypothetical protein [Ruminococcus sp.]